MKINSNRREEGVNAILPSDSENRRRLKILKYNENMSKCQWNEEAMKKRLEAGGESCCKIKQWKREIRRKLKANQYNEYPGL